MRLLSIIFILTMWPFFAFAGEERHLQIYHDADWANSSESSEAIWRGMQLALKEIDFVVNGTRIELVKKNHGGNVTRSLRNMKEFLSDDKAIAVFSGMHSPPLITHRDFINENKIPVLVPWAAGGPITRYPSAQNYIFRLSVDDTKAGNVLIDHAARQYDCVEPYIILENTSWGDSNSRNMKLALQRRGEFAAGIKRFDWSLKSHVAQSIIENVIRERAKCIILVSSTSEGAQISMAMSKLAAEKRIPIISHWGITGGNFHERVKADTRSKIDLSFIQSCSSFLDDPMPPLAKSVFQSLQSLYPEHIKQPKDITSPAGLIHAYDLTKLFIAALEQVELTDNIATNRESLKEALESLNQPISGLVKTYQNPFSEFSPSNLDAHEALNQDDICMASYGQNDEIIINRKREK